MTWMTVASLALSCVALVCSGVTLRNLRSVERAQRERLGR